MDSEISIKDILTRYRKIVVVGLSPEPSRPSHWIAVYLAKQGYEVCGVNPGHTAIEGIPIYDSIASVPGDLEIVNVFRKSEYIPQIVQEILPRRPAVLWLQDGVSHESAEAAARQAGMRVISNDCIYRRHRSLISSGAGG